MTPPNDAEYLKLLERLVKGAEYLENPIIKPEDYRKGMALYDALLEEIRNHQNRLRENDHSDQPTAASGERFDLPRAS